MPIAVNGERRFQASMTFWLGATQASNPYPVKSPGAWGSAAWAVDGTSRAAARPRVPAMTPSTGTRVGEGTRIGSAYRPEFTSVTQITSVTRA